MTQEEFAEYMCVTRQSVSKWETDKAYPDVEKLIKIAELYSVSLDYLVTGQDKVVYIEKSNAENLPVQVNDVDAENMENSDKINTSNKSMIPLKICLGILGLFVVLSISAIIMFLIQNPWFHSDISEQSVKVDKVYGQLSVVEVSYEDEDDNILKEKIFLDTTNIRQGDYVDAYINTNGDLFFDYGAGIIVAVVVFLILNLIAIMLIVKELVNS